MTCSPFPTATYTPLQRREAADWFVVIRNDDDPGMETLQAWLRWLETEEGNRLAFEAVARAWHGTPASLALGMPGTDELQEDDYEGEQPVDEWLANHPSAIKPSTRNAKTLVSHRNRVPRWAWLAAASLVAVTVGLIQMNRFLDVRRPRSDEFVTKTSEQVAITLADGSRVWLGPRSKLLVEYTRERRDIQLPAGEAFFSVVKDRSRPFIVRSSSGDITAVGTAFNVRAVADHVTVAVSEGVVTVAPKPQVAASQPATVRVASGQQLTFRARESVEALAILQSPAPGERARWRDGVLVYRDEPLRDVVRDVARYSDKQLEISDGAVGDLHYSGIVYQSAVAEWTSALPESFPVKITNEGNREIIEAR